MHEMTAQMAAFDAAPGYMAGEYSDAVWFKAFVSIIEWKFPGAGKYVEMAADLLPWAKLARAVQNAWADWQAGKDFITILKEAFLEWGIEVDDTEKPIRMAMKSA